MRPVLASLLLTTTLPPCALNLGRGREADVPTVAVRAEAGASAAEIAQALRGAGADFALVAGPGDEAWFRALAQASGLELSGPGEAASDLRLAFLGPEAVGDTTIELEYEGGSFVLHDALYTLPGDQYLDLMAFRVERPEAARPLIASLLGYVATDVMPQAAVVMAVAVPNQAVGDSVAQMFSPGYFDARRCAGTAGQAGAEQPAGRTIRLFYGPEARIRCDDAELAGTAFGEWVRAALVATRR